MRAAVVLGDDLDVLVLLASVQLVLDAEVEEVDLIVEVRQVVLVRPALNLAGVSIRPPVAVGSAAIMFLEPLLITAFELLVEDDAVDVCAFFPEAFRFAHVGPIQLHVVLQLTRSIDTGVEGLFTPMPIAAAMAFQETVTALGERDGAIAAVQLNGFRQTLRSKVTQVGIAAVARFISAALEVSFGNDPKRSHGCDCPAVVAIELVALVAIQHEFSLETARQLDAVEKYLSRIEVSVAAIAISVTIAEVAWTIWVVVDSQRAVQFYPARVDVADVIMTITVTWIEVQGHALLAGCT